MPQKSVKCTENTPNRNPLKTHPYKLPQYSQHAQREGRTQIEKKCKQARARDREREWESEEREQELQSRRKKLKGRERESSNMHLSKLENTEQCISHWCSCLFLPNVLCPVLVLSEVQRQAGPHITVLKNTVEIRWMERAGWTQPTTFNLTSVDRGVLPVTRRWWWQ